MSEKGMPETANRLTPYLVVQDALKARDFYAAAFGFTPDVLVPGEDGKPMHVGMNYEGKSIVMFSPEGVGPSEKARAMRAPASSGHAACFSLYVYCADVDALTDCARKAGAEVVSEPEEMFWGDRIAQFRDPGGYEWTFATKVKDFDGNKDSATG